MPQPNFYYDGSALVCDGVSLGSLAEAVGTPAYVYSADSIIRACTDLDRAFGSYPHRLHYAIKANSTLAIARLLQSLGGGADANSVGEIEVALRAGFRPDDIVFSGVGKRADEMERAVKLGIHAINAESVGEVERIRAIARAAGVRARVAVRVNPDIDAESHPHISTGLAASKFGVPVETAREVCRRFTFDEGVAIVGLHVHVGSQITSLEPLKRAAQVLADLGVELRSAGVPLEHIDMGGGVGIDYRLSESPTVRESESPKVGEGRGGPAMTAREYAEGLLSVIRPTGLKLLVEPGRMIVAPAGVLLSRVVDIKRAPEGEFVVLDAGMTELLRPALYGAYHRIEPLLLREGSEKQYQFVGPLCETSDSYGEPRTTTPLQVGDLVAIRDIGGYGSVMASNYNRRLLAPEVLVKDGAWRTIRRRQTIEDLLALETARDE